MITASIVETMITHGISAIIGGLIGVASSILTARYSAKKQQFYVATSQFRAEFVDALVLLRDGKKDEFLLSFRGTLANHNRAKVLFEPWIADRKRASFELAWNEYVKVFRKFVTTRADDISSTGCKEMIRMIENFIKHTEK